MEVTISNFKDKIPVIEKAIKNANFLSVDGEFSGLNQSWNLNAYDTPEERFDKVRQNAEDFLLIQFGLCAFYYNEETEKYTHQAFNFYIFPRMYKKIIPDKRFYCQASSLDFLASQGFDFNKLIKTGIPYVRVCEESSVRESLAQRQAQRLEEQEAVKEDTANGTATPKTACVVPDEHKKFIDAVHTQVEEFLSGETKVLQLSPCSGYRRKLIYETVRPKFSNVIIETVQIVKGQPQIQLTKADKEAAKKKMEATIQAENEELEEAIGFMKVMKMISESEKLIIGHNMFLDILHIINQFYCELPEKYEDLRVLIKSVLPRVIDTKVMASTSPFKEHFQNTGLNNILKRLSEKPFSCETVEPVQDCPGYSTTSELLHEAGYDAYITGLCFISLVQHLHSLQKKNKKARSKDCGSSALIQPFINKVYMMMSPDIPYINLSGFDLKPNRDHVYHFTFPCEWKTQDIFNHFTDYGPVSVSFINDTTAFVALKHPEKSSAATRGMMKKNNEVHKVITYEDFSSRQRLKVIGEEKTVSSSHSKTMASGTAKRKNSCEESPVRQDSGNECKTDETEKSGKEVPNPKRLKPVSKMFDEPSNWD